MSKAGEVAAAIKTAMEGLTLAPGMTWHVRRTPTLPSGTNPPAGVVVVQEEGESVPLTATEKLKTYPSAVVLFLAGGHKVGDDDVVRGYRDQIERTVDDKDLTTFASVSGFNKATAGGKSPYDPAALNLDLVAGTQVFQVEVIETRAHA